MIKLMIFDLDNTLFDTYNQLSKPIFEDMIERMKVHGLAPLLEIELRKNYKFTGFKSLAERLGIKESVINAGLRAYDYMDLSKITPYPDVNVLATIPCEKIIVTSGMYNVQQDKVKQLGIMQYFSQLTIDETISAEGKVRLFKTAADDRNLEYSQVMAIGDNPYSEILAGNYLGMRTVQIMRHPGEVMVTPTQVITNLDELVDVYGSIK